jgi:hypothetical protein
MEFINVHGARRHGNISSLVIHMRDCIIHMEGNKG